jgi:ribonuclease HII
MLSLVCGVDEVGRGSLAGPLMAVAASFWSEHGWTFWDRGRSPIEGVKDSKAFSSDAKRTEVFHRILRSQSLFDFGLGEVSVEEINRHGIDDANQMAFQRALADLKQPPNFVIIDGNKPILGWSNEHQSYLPKADNRWWPVSAASILAKVIRDSYMTELSEDFPIYQWDSNAGYGSEDHITAIRQYGPSIHHRKQFVKNIRRAI